MGSIMTGDIKNIDGIILTPLKVIDVHGGNVLHGMKRSDPGYLGFGEAYFSIVESGAIKAWKRHKLMTLNLIVCSGGVRFVMYDNRQDLASENMFQEVILSNENYCRLTIPPMVWFGFQGIRSETNMLLNIVDIEHSPEEIDRLNLNEINYNWERV
jgi:dTDP-4-dehydrorhamnose 3,5-epimerase